MRSNPRGAWTAWPLAAACMLAVAGCAGVVAPTTRAAVDASLSTLDEPQNRRTIQEILNSEEVLRATKGLTRAVIDEALSGGPASEGRLTTLSNNFARDISPALGRTVDEVVLPRVQAAVAGAVRSALDETLSDANRQRIASFTADVARRTVASVGPQIEASISHAVERILQHDLSPAIGKALEDNTPALARTTRAMTAAALDGVNDAMSGPFGDMFRKERKITIAQVQAAESAQQKALMTEIENQIADSRRWFVALVVVGAVVGIALLAVGAVLWHLLAEHRKLRDRLLA